MKIRSILLIALIIGFTISASESYSQDAKTRSMMHLKMHKEKSSDAYLPNAHNNKKTSPAYYYNNSASARTAASTIITTQVNIDSLGQNILGDAANEPSIAISPLDGNKIAIGWRQFDNVASSFRQAGYSYSTDAGTTWTFPGVIEPGIFRSDPVLDYDDQGNFYYNSLTNSPDYFCTVFKSTDGGATWGAGTLAHGGDKQWMTIDRTGGVGNGNIYSSWTFAYTTCDTGYFTRSTDGNISYDTCTTIDGLPYWLTMDVGNAGELFIAGASPNMPLTFVKSLNAQMPGSLVTWSSPVSVDLDGSLGGWTSVNPSGLLGQANIGVDKSNGSGRDNIYVLASVERFSTSDPGDVMFSRSTDDGATWSAPIKINDDGSNSNYQWLAAMSVAPNGRIDAAWLDTRDATGANPDESALYYSYSTDEGMTWSVNEKLSAVFDPHIGYPQQQKMGDYFDMISDSTSAHLAWANTLNGGQDVYHSQITPPVITSVDDLADKSSIVVYPNPTKGAVTVAGIKVGSDLEVINVLGELIYSEKIEQSEINLDLVSETNGIYFIKVIDSNGKISSSKILVE